MGGTCSSRLRKRRPNGRLFRLDMFDGNVEMALAAYNAGPMAVKKHGPTVNAEAIEYVAKIMTYL